LARGERRWSEGAEVALVHVELRRPGEIDGAVDLGASRAVERERVPGIVVLVIAVDLRRRGAETIAATIGHAAHVVEGGVDALVPIAHVLARRARRARGGGGARAGCPPGIGTGARPRRPL